MSEQNPSLVSQAFDRLRQDVLVGRFAAGTKLKIEDLQTTYGFSSSPLREALSRLSQEGLVRADERRGFRVAPLSLEDMKDITRARLVVETQTLQDAIEHGDERWESDVVGNFYRLEKIESRLPEGPVVLNAEWSAMHRDFHMTLLSACPSLRFLSWSQSLFDQAERYRQFSARHRKSLRRKSNEHKKLMDATLRRDRETAVALLTEHILSTQRNVEAAFAAQSVAHTG